jgi:hypothetical protein
MLEVSQYPISSYIEESFKYSEKKNKKQKTDIKTKNKKTKNRYKDQRNRIEDPYGATQLHPTDF